MRYACPQLSGFRKASGSTESHYTYNLYTYSLYMHLFHSVWSFKEKSQNKRYLINACCLYWLYTCTWLEVLINIEMYSYNLPQNLDRYRGILPKRDRLWRNKGKKILLLKLRWIASLKIFIFVYNLYCYKDRFRWIRFVAKTLKHTINTIMYLGY